MPCKPHVRVRTIVDEHYNILSMTDTDAARRPTPILVADMDDSLALLEGCLHPHFDVVHASTMQQALALVRPDTSLVLCGAHFDDGRMYDLLRHLKAQPALASVPFMAVRALPGELDDVIYESVKIATTALGANGFIDMVRLQAQHGHEEARRRLLERVRALTD